MPESVSDMVTRRRTSGANRFEQGNFNPDRVPSSGLSEALGPHQKYRERIQNMLEEFLPAHEARDTAMQIYDLALDVDKEIGRILKDPLVLRLYEYGGRFFIPRGTQLFYTAFDGLHLLKSLRDSRRVKPVSARTSRSRSIRTTCEISSA